MLLSSCSKNSKRSLRLSILSLSLWAAQHRGTKQSIFTEHTFILFIMYLVYVMTSFRVADGTVHMWTTVHMAMRKSKLNESLPPPLWAWICATESKMRCVLQTVEGVTGARTAHAKTHPDKPTNRRAVVVLLIHKCQRGSLRGNDKGLREFQSLIYKELFKGRRPM